MKSILFTLIVVMTSTVSAQIIPQDMLDACIEWQGYKSDDDSYKGFKKSLGGVDPDEVDPMFSRRAKISKIRFDNARKKYEKKTGKKFNSNVCNQ